MRVAALAFAGLLVTSPSAFADPASSPWFSVPLSALFQTGDSWVVDGFTYRLYGVQSCLRGTSVTNAHGVKRDCGEASLAMLVALSRDLRPHCHAAARAPTARTVFVFCVAQRTSGAGAGSRIDLGTALVASGFAFAALRPDGQPVHAPYLAAQQVAERSRAGLWAFPDLPNPNVMIQRALTNEPPVASPTRNAADPSPPDPLKPKRFP